MLMIQSKPLSYQRGIGLIEVLVALMLLAIAVLGFSAMQMVSVKATDESVIRSRALTIMRGGAEMMRANPDGIAAFKYVLKPANEPNPSPMPYVDSTITKDSCLSTANATVNCSINQLAIRDAKQLQQFAEENDINLSAITCPDTVTASTSMGRRPLTCLVASWGETTATVGNTLPHCIKSDGTYIIGSTCFVMEAY